MYNNIYCTREYSSWSSYLLLRPKRPTAIESCEHDNANYKNYANLKDNHSVRPE